MRGEITIITFTGESYVSVETLFWEKKVKSFHFIVTILPPILMMKGSELSGRPVAC